jgi:hypothetical protein
MKVIDFGSSSGSYEPRLQSWTSQSTPFIVIGWFCSLLALYTQYGTASKLLRKTLAKWACK